MQVAFFRKKEGCVACCPATRVSSARRDLNLARISVEKSVNFLLQSLAEKGILISSLLDLGWSIGKSPRHLLIPPFYNSRKALIGASNGSDSEFLASMEITVKIPASFNALLKEIEAPRRLGKNPNSNNGDSANLPGFLENQSPDN